MEYWSDRVMDFHPHLNPLGFAHGLRQSPDRFVGPRAKQFALYPEGMPSSPPSMGRRGDGTI